MFEGPEFGKEQIPRKPEGGTEEIPEAAVDQEHFVTENGQEVNVSNVPVGNREAFVQFTESGDHHTEAEEQFIEKAEAAKGKIAGGAALGAIGVAGTVVLPHMAAFGVAGAAIAGKGGIDLVSASIGRNRERNQKEAAYEQSREQVLPADQIDIGLARTEMEEALAAEEEKMRLRELETTKKIPANTEETNIRSNHNRDTISAAVLDKLSNPHTIDPNVKKWLGIRKWPL